MMRPLRRRIASKRENGIRVLARMPFSFVPPAGKFRAPGNKCVVRQPGIVRRVVVTCAARASALGVLHLGGARRVALG